MGHGSQHLMDVEHGRWMLGLDRRRILRQERVQRIDRTLRRDLRHQVPAHVGKIAFDEAARFVQNLLSLALQLFLPHPQIGLLAFDIGPAEQCRENRTGLERLIDRQGGATARVRPSGSLGIACFEMPLDLVLDDRLNVVQQV